MKIILDPTIAPQQKLFIGRTLLGVPVLAVEKTLQKLIQDPAAVEIAISRLRDEGGGNSIGWHYNNPVSYLKIFLAVNGDLPKSDTVGGHGVILVSGSLDQVESDTEIAAPDITFDVRGFGEFSTIPAQHFTPSDPELRLLQVPKKFTGFAQWLISQKNWIITTLRDCYHRIGKSQAEFLLRLHPDYLRQLPVSHIPETLDLPHHSFTYFRLLRNRSVRIAAPHVTRTLPIEFLLPTKEDITVYRWIPTFNRVMRDELTARTALSDEDLSILVKDVARRTIAKYRELADIPSRSARQKAYDKGRKKSYRIVLAIERFLREDWSSKAVRDRYVSRHWQ
jgi:hypothetical protein